LWWKHRAWARVWCDGFAAWTSLAHDGGWAHCDRGRVVLVVVNWKSREGLGTG
jgi:hypothetical protein